MVRVDGSIEIRQSLKPIVDEFERGKYDRCVMMHPYRNTMEIEYREWVRTRNYPAAQAAKCMKAMERFGFDEAQAKWENEGLDAELFFIEDEEGNQIVFD